MKLQDLNMGDVVYAAKDIFDDGSMPDGQEGRLLSKAGSRGVVVMTGHLEENPDKDVFLIRFEDENLDLGEPIGCFEEDLRLSVNA